MANNNNSIELNNITDNVYTAQMITIVQQMRCKLLSKTVEEKRLQSLGKRCNRHYVHACTDKLFHVTGSATATLRLPMDVRVLGT